MPGMSMSGSGGGVVNLLPAWLGVAGAVLFLAVLASHLRHAAQTSGERRWWHCGHVLMAASMAVMYLPASVATIGIPAAVWQSAFATLAVVLLVSGAVMLCAHRAPSALWLLLILDMAAMTYMWTPSAGTVVLSWIAALYLLVQALLWASDRIRVIDRPWTAGGYALSGGGVVCAAPGAELATEFDLRISMCVMSTGMAYMIIAMQVMR
jgi:hypothetical protein